MSANQEQFLKLCDVQKLLGVSRSTVWRWTAELGLKVVRVGGVVRVREADLQAFLARHIQVAESEAIPLPPPSREVGRN